MHFCEAGTFADGLHVGGALVSVVIGVKTEVKSDAVKHQHVRVFLENGLHVDVGGVAGKVGEHVLSAGKFDEVGPLGCTGQHDRVSCQRSVVFHHDRRTVFFADQVDSLVDLGLYSVKFLKQLLSVVFPVKERGEHTNLVA